MGAYAAIPTLLKTKTRLEMSMIGSFKLQLTNPPEKRVFTDILYQ
jgi:hypothetical protein